MMSARDSGDIRYAQDRCSTRGFIEILPADHAILPSVTIHIGFQWFQGRQGRPSRSSYMTSTSSACATKREMVKNKRIGRQRQQNYGRTTYTGRL